MDVYQFVQRFYDSVKTEKTVIGRSLFGRELYAVKLGDGLPVGIAQYGIHGREYITAKLAVAQYDYGKIVGSIWVIPLVNPDGALLSQVGITSAPMDNRDGLLALNGGEDFSSWKANGRGVDLNVNFSARWGTGAKNVKRAGAENYIGEKPFSEVETLSLKRFTEKIRPQYTISYHTKGEEIYWRFFQTDWRLERDKHLAEVLSRSTGYPLAESKNSVGGYKDWCIETLKIPSFTIEVGEDWRSHPLGEDALTGIIAKNQRSLAHFSREYGKTI